MEGALLRATDELLGDALITDETWAVLAGALEERQLMDVVFTVGAYDVLAMVLRTFAVPLDDDLLPHQSLRTPGRGLSPVGARRAREKG